MEAYLDNSATTKCAAEVVETAVKVMSEDYGNPSSKHMKGVDAEKYIREAKEIIAKTLKCQDKEILFTSGGTESNCPTRLAFYLEVNAILNSLLPFY